MAYVGANYATNTDAPVGKWVCSPGSGKGPFDTWAAGVGPYEGAEVKEKIHSWPTFCGQCVSFVKTICPTLPATSSWKKGEAVKGSKTIRPGTVIANFNASDLYEGHAAIFHSQDENGIVVYDQWRSFNAKKKLDPKPIGSRYIKWEGSSPQNSGNAYYIVE
jgi:hypothetical protein